MGANPRHIVLSYRACVHQRLQTTARVRPEACTPNRYHSSIYTHKGLCLQVAATHAWLLPAARNAPQHLYTVYSTDARTLVPTGRPLTHQHIHCMASTQTHIFDKATDTSIIDVLRHPPIGYRSRDTRSRFNQRANSNARPQCYSLQPHIYLCYMPRVAASRIPGMLRRVCCTRGLEHENSPYAVRPRTCDAAAAAAAANRSLTTAAGQRRGS